MRLDGGLIKKHSITFINIIAFGTILIINIFDQIQRQQSFMGRIIYTLPFLVLMILCFIFRNKYKFNAFLYAGMSVLALLTTSESGNLTGIIFLLFSLFVFQSLRTNIIILIITSIAILSKIFMGYTAMEIIGTFLGYAYCILIYYILIHPKQPKITNSMDDVDRQILELKISGHSTKEIADKIYLSSDAINKRMKRACEKYECGNTEQLVFTLIEKGYISLN